MDEHEFCTAQQELTIDRYAATQIAHFSWQQENFVHVTSSYFQNSSYKRQTEDVYTLQDFNQNIDFMKYMFG